MNSHDHTQGMTADDWATLDDVVVRYETAWRRGERPPLEQGLPAAAGARRTVLFELIRGELEVRLRAGEAARVEDYLQRFPEVGAAADEVLALLTHEHELRRRQEPHLGLEEYQRRFPEHSAGLTAHLQSAAGHTALLPKPAAAPPRSPSPAIGSVADLSGVLADGRLLEATQASEAESLQKGSADPRALAKELVQRGWLTPWQVNQLFLRRAGELRLGPYLLLDRLGEGGMGTVYKARHSVMRRLVALKVIRRDRLAGRDSVRRFYREVRAVARLAHPNIVLAYDAAEVDGTHILVMEYVDGSDLARLVRRQGALPVAQACDYVRQAALGLQHAHEQGLVHRDVKPANLLLAQAGGGAGMVKVLDLGLARLQLAAGEQTGGELTAEGSVMGTPDYMAPEQGQQSHDVDIRADVYSLGCTLYFLLTGQVPFPGGTLAQKLIRHYRDQPAPVEGVRPDVPAALGEVLRKLMAKRPEERYQVPAEAAAVLLPFCPAGAVPAAAPVSVTVPVSVVSAASAGPATETVTLPATAPARPGRVVTWVRQSPRRLAAVVGGVLLLAVVLVLLLRPRSGAGEDGDGPDGGSRWPVDNLRPVVAAGGQADWLPEGLVLVLGSHRGRHWGPVRAVAFSADGKLVASAGDDQFICVWQADTLEAYRVLKGHKGPVLCLAFAPDGRLLSGGQDRTVRLWDVARRKELRKLEGHTDPVACLAVSADGKRALSGGAGGVDFTVRLWDLGSGEQRQCFTEHKGPVSSVTFAADGRQAVSGSHDKTMRRWDLGTGKEVRRQEFLPRGVNSNGHMTLSGDGKWGVFDTASGAGWMEVEAAQQPRITGDGQSLGTLAVSTAGGRFAGAGGPRFTVYDLQSGALQRSFQPGEPLSSLAFSPDGCRLVSGTDGGLVQVWDIESGKEVVPRPGHTGAVYALDIAKDGRHVLTGGVDKAVRLWDLASSPPGQEVKRLDGHTAPVTTVVLLPDGKRVVSASQDNTVRSWDLKTGKEQWRTPVPRVVGVSADGRLVGTPIANAAIVLAAESGKQLQQVPVRFGTILSMAFSPDGRRWAALGDQPVLHVWTVKAEPALRDHPVGSAGFGAFSADSRFLLTGHQDGAVHLWDMEKSQGAQLRTFAGIVTQISSVAWAVDQKAVAASSSKGRVFVWETDSGKVLGEWQMPGAVHGVAFLPDGRHLLTANGNGTAYVLRLKSSPSAGSP